MFSLDGNSSRHRNLTRRECLRAGYLGLGGLALPDLLRLRSLAAPIATGLAEPACILVWLGGGPSHLDTYDLKPGAPAEYRGIYQSIPTRVPGMDVCEL